jgi:hypothetical protein
MRIPMGWRICLVMIVAGFSAWALVEVAAPSRATRAADSRAPSQYVTAGIFTTAHPTVVDSVKDFFDIHPEHPVQPIAYTHTVHLAKGLPCTFCHVGVDQGPEARIPGVNVCMSCHSSIATDRPEIMKIAAYKARGEEIPWVRVYNAACHSDMTRQTTAERKVDLNMGFCLNCHTQKKVSIDCETCHY